MTNTKESLGLHAISDGPAGGIYSRGNQANLVIKAPPVGTPHFTNWDAGLTSLENTTKERFESRTATRFLDTYMENLGSTKRFRCGAKDIKIVDNIAAVSYPEYTDIRKTTHGPISTDLLTIHSGQRVNAYDYNCITWEPSASFAIMPIFNLDNVFGDMGDAYPEYSQRWAGPIDFSNMYVVITYNGNYTKNNVDPCLAAANYYESTLDNKMQILKWSSSDPASLQEGEYTTYTHLTPTGGQKIMLAANISSDLFTLLTDIGPTEYYVNDPLGNPFFVTGFGKIGCSVTILKYQPVVECGKVDIYTKKNGKINSYAENGKLISLRHNLQNGDIIKISDAQNSEINGVRYIQVVSDSTFIAYKDVDFTERVNSYYDGQPVWTACGNIYNKESQSWDYLGSLVGSNNYSTSPDISSNNLTIGEEFNNAQTIDDIFKIDFGVSDTQLEVFNAFPLTRTSIYDSFFSSLDFTSSEQDGVKIKRTGAYATWQESAHNVLWSSPASFLWSFKFGCSIDLIKYKDRYVLAVGQKGLDNIQSFAGLHMPSSVYGQAFLYDIYIDSDNKVLEPQSPTNSILYPSQNPVRLNKIVYAHTNDSDIAEPPPSYYDAGFQPLARDEFMARPTDFDFPFFNYSGGISKPFYDYCLYGYPGDDYNLIEYSSGMDYWYGSMVYSLTGEEGSIDTAGIRYYTNNNCRNSYFTNLKVPEFLPGDFSLYQNPPVWSRAVFNVYPFIDNFGKAVALDMVGSDFYLFASSKTKKEIERTTSGGVSESDFIFDTPECTNTFLNKTDCGYIHVFKLEDDPTPDNLLATKIQKIYEASSFTLPSGKYYGFYYKAQKFGSYIFAKNGELIFGQTKPIEYYITPGEDIEKSKIFIYKKQGSTYNKIGQIENANHSNFSFINTHSYADQKEHFLRDGRYLGGALGVTDDRYNLYYYPPDRFGNYFRYNSETLVTNAFDIYNEDGEYHGTNNNVYPDRSNEFNRPIDYLCVYEKNNGQWNFITKIAPAFDQYDPSYSYGDVISPNIYNSIRALGNKNYSNNSFNSKTWDIDLTGCYDLVNDRILLKDPLSYSVFQKDVDYINSSRTEARLTLDKYFTYDEKYEAESGLLTSCQLKFDRISAIHKYDTYLDDYKNLYCENNQNGSIQSLNYRAPIYFINIPINSENITQFNSITLKLEEVRSINAGVNLKLVLFKKDPRTTVYPFYQNICTPNATDESQKKWRSSLSYTQQTYLKGGVFDSSLYADNSSGNIWESCEGSSCMAKLINASNILISGARRDYTFIIDNTQVDLNDFIIQDNLILDSNNDRIIGRPGIPDETIEFNDLANIGHDTSVNVEASIIVGFIYQPMNYKIDSNFNARADVRIIDITFDGYTSITPSPTSEVDLAYRCKFNKVVSFDYLRTYYNNPANKTTVYESNESSYPEGKLIYTNPIIRAGVVPVTAFNDTRSGTIDGVFSKSYEVLSIDNFGTTPETSVFTNTRSLDLQYLETLPMYMQGIEYIPYINLFMKTPEIANSETNLFLQNQGKDNNFTLHIVPYAAASGSQNLRINGAFYGSGDFTQHIVGGPSAAIPLFLKVSEPSTSGFSTYLRGFNYGSGDMSLYIGDIVQSVAPLYLKSRDLISGTGDLNQIIYGSTDGSSFMANNIPLFISVFDDSRRSEENNAPLNIIGPDTYSQSGINSIPLYIGQIVRNSSGNLSLFNFGGFGGYPLATGVNFVIKNTGINSSGAMPLSIPNKGFNGSDVIAHNTFLFLSQSEASGDIRLFLNGAVGEGSGIDLYLNTGFGVLSSGNTTFIRGYRS